MSRYIQTPPKEKKAKPKERKVPLSQPGKYNQKVMEAAKPVYGQEKM